SPPRNDYGAHEGAAGAREYLWYRIRNEHCVGREDRILCDRRPCLGGDGADQQEEADQVTSHVSSLHLREYGISHPGALDRGTLLCRRPPHATLHPAGTGADRPYRPRRG